MIRVSSASFALSASSLFGMPLVPDAPPSPETFPLVQLPFAQPKPSYLLKNKIQTLRVSTRLFACEAAHLDKLQAFALAEPPLAELFGDAVLPTKIAFDRAFRLLFSLEEAALEPVDILPSGEGGIAFIFEAPPSKSERPVYADIECLNSGSVIATIDTWRERPRIWRLDDDPRTWPDALDDIRTALFPGHAA